MGLWKKIEILTLENPPALLDQSDQCFYARDYVSGGSWDSSEANQLIRNFKKSPSKRNTREWGYKESAVAKFAEELDKVLGQGCAIAFIPPSKKADDPECDPRGAMLRKALERIRPDLKYKCPIVRESSCLAVHKGGKRTMSAIQASLRWQGFKTCPESLAIIDDVITTGAHFKVCQSMIRERHPFMPIFGIFWARVTWPESNPFAT